MRGARLSTGRVPCAGLYFQRPRMTPIAVNPTTR